MPDVLILVGSESDKPRIEPAFEILTKAGFSYEFFASSAHRQPEQTGEGTEWLVYQIDPNKSEPMGFVRLPTHASHLSVVVDRDFWYLFEKGPVGAGGEQKIDKVLMVPTQWITSPAASRLNISADDVKCLPRKTATTTAPKK